MTTLYSIQHDVRSSHSQPSLQTPTGERASIPMLITPTPTSFSNNATRRKSTMMDDTPFPIEDVSWRQTIYDKPSCTTSTGNTMNSSYNSASSTSTTSPETLPSTSLLQFHSDCADDEERRSPRRNRFSRRGSSKKQQLRTPSSSEDSTPSSRHRRNYKRKSTQQRDDGAGCWRHALYMIYTRGLMWMLLLVGISSITLTIVTNRTIAIKAHQEQKAVLYLDVRRRTHATGLRRIPIRSQATSPQQQQQLIRVAMPPHLPTLERTYDAVDTKLYRKPTTLKQHPRTIKLHDSIRFKQRTLQTYPSDYTDQTQLYGILDSSDERIQDMELRTPLTDDTCVPMQEWQTTFYPFCNGVHEVDLTHSHLFGTKGYWRNAWRVDLDRDGGQRDTIVLKTLKIEHRFEEAHFEHDRIDAIAMERLTSSPHVINMFGFCGHSVMTEYADGNRLGELADKSRKIPLARLQIATDIANGLADVHGIDGDGNTTFVHLDINPANVVSIGGTLKLNDFNIGILRRWNTTSNRPCGFPAQYPNPQWRSPEEARDEQNLTEKVDVYSLGHILFRLICGHEPWNKLEKGGKPSKLQVHEKVKRGILPAIPKFVKDATDPEMMAMREAMLRCYTFDPVKRPSARDIANSLQHALAKLKARAAS